MCYSAEVKADYKKYVRDHGADIDIETFYDLYWRKAKGGEKLKTPKAMDDAFSQPQTEREQAIKALIDEFKLHEAQRLQQTLFEQRKRLADDERKLAIKPTKTATESARIARDRIEDARRGLESLHRPALTPEDSRIYPGGYAPVIVMENGRRVVKPMRYRCRPAGKPAFYDTKFPGIYNARRDSLDGFWKDLFGFSHGIVVVRRFYEHVKRHDMEHRALRPGETPENVILRFDPNPPQDILIACLWSRWTSPGEPDLLSFAAITDEPPPEVAAAGHDRCIIPIRPENIDAWLNPAGLERAALYRILDDRPQTFYEHRLAA